MPRRIGFAAALTLLLCSIVFTQEAAPAALQGRWVVVSGENNGKPFDAIKGGVMTITGSAFEIRTASGRILVGTLRVDASKVPAEMDLLHADGERWAAIYETTGETLTLNYSEVDGQRPRPTNLKNAAKMEETLILLRREAR